MQALLHKKSIFLMVIIGIISSMNVFSLGMTDESYFSDPIDIHYLSPQNHDGIQDRIQISLPDEMMGTNDMAIESVIFKVYDINGNVFFDYQGQYDKNQTYFYAAESNDQKGLQNGIYLYNITAYYSDGTTRKSSPTPIIVDNTTPMGVSASLDLSIEDIAQAYANKNINAMIQGKTKTQTNMMADNDGAKDMMQNSQISQEPLDSNNLPQIFFTPFSHSVFSNQKKEMSQENLQYISSIASFLMGNSEYDIQIIGHAAALLSGEEQIVEQKDVLIPLSLKRAESVRDALILLGIDSSRIQVKGVGNSEPLSKRGELDYYAKNRRVEFQLQN